jgi:preprotein translocase SecE subunit
MHLAVHNKGQGNIVRWSAFGLLGALALFAARSFYTFPITVRGGQWWWVENPEPLRFLGTLGLDLGTILAALLFAALLAADYWTVFCWPKAADFLIETEGELRRVSWPPRHEFLGSSFVVIVSVIVLGVYLLVVDFGLTFTLLDIILPG